MPLHVTGCNGCNGRNGCNGCNGCNGEHACPCCCRSPDITASEMPQTDQRCDRTVAQAPGCWAAQDTWQGAAAGGARGATTRDVAYVAVEPNALLRAAGRLWPRVSPHFQHSRSQPTTRQPFDPSLTSVTPVTPVTSVTSVTSVPPANLSSLTSASIASAGQRLSVGASVTLVTPVSSVTHLSRSRRQASASAWGRPK